jgi:NitT/TauT family transport system substrate-binding protein
MKHALWLRWALLALALLLGPSGVVHAQTKLKMILNWKYQGPQGIFFLAVDKGYLKEEGIELEMDQGKGSGAAVGELARGTYQVAFGDINTAIQLAASRPKESPVAVYMMYNEPPFSIASRKTTGILRPKDLEGRSLAAPAGSATLKLLQLVAEKDGVDLSKVNIVNASANLLEQMMLRGQVDAVAGFVSTIAMSSKALGMDPDKDLNWLMYSKYGVNLYGNALLVSRDLAQNNPAVVRGLVRAVNRAVGDTARDPDAAIDALMKREPLLKRDVEKETLQRTMKVEMNHPEGRDIGFGDVSDERLRRSIEQVRKTFELSRSPEPQDVFNRQFLPPKAERNFKF